MVLRRPGGESTGRRPWPDAVPAPLHEPLARIVEPDPLIELVRVAGVQEPHAVGVRPFVHTEADELDAEPAAAVLRLDVDVGEVGVRAPVGRRAREPDLLPLEVEA